MKTLLTIAMILISVPAWAQQQSPSQIAVQIEVAVGVLSQRAENAELQIKQLQEQIAALKVQCGDKCK